MDRSESQIFCSSYYKIEQNNKYSDPLFEKLETAISTKFLPAPAIFGGAAELDEIIHGLPHLPPYKILWYWTTKLPSTAALSTMRPALLLLIISSVIFRARFQSILLTLILSVRPPGLKTPLLEMI